ncbi:MAG TPA: SDR family NAD(P)-dependent oxidoreductase [Polyangiaceae bacterium]|nr:SDR family NAD(P)-dependent oxidoreductase [Polyangiaceae bacterium]
MPRGLLRGRVAVVTGAASGIGRATAVALAEAGAAVAGCDLDEGGLEQTLQACRARGVATLGMRADVGEAKQVQVFAERAERELGPTFCLVNNAGVGVAGGFLDTEPGDWEWLLRVNLWGTINATRAFGPRLCERGEGRIVNVASASGFCNLPALAAYGTTKYAIMGLSEALRAELLPHGVKVSVVCPALVNTPIVQTARIRGATDASAERQALLELYQKRGASPESVANAIVAAAESGKALVPVSSEAWLLYLLKRAAPSALPWLLRVSTRLYQK